MGLEVRVDRDRCMGSGNCMFRAPGAFDMDEEGFAFVSDPDAASLDQLRLAEAECPTRAISVSVTAES